MPSAGEVAGEFGVKTSHYVIGGVALVAALSWKDTIRTYVDETFPMPKERKWANFIYSIVITLVLILIIYLLPDTKKELPVRTQAKMEEVKLKTEIQNANAEVEKLKSIIRKENYETPPFAQYKQPKFVGLKPFANGVTYGL
jgi:uncharacterized membrane protein